MDRTALGLEQAVARAEGWSAQEALAWALETFGERAAICTSFQAEGVVLIDMAHRLGLRPRVITVDTGRLPEETYQLMDTVRERYGLDIEVHHPDHRELAEMVRKFGVNGFYRSVSLRLMCCELRKVKPLARALEGLEAWVTGLRREQARTRAHAARVEVDHEHGGIAKVNPLVDWDLKQVWDYIERNQVPYNRLYDAGYATIGCAPCTRPVRPGEDPRAGRWWWEQGVPKECGIHMSPAWRRVGGDVGRQSA